MEPLEDRLAPALSATFHVPTATLLVESDADDDWRITSDFDTGFAKVLTADDQPVPIVRSDGNGNDVLASDVQVLFAQGGPGDNEIGLSLHDFTQLSSRDDIVILGAGGNDTLQVAEISIGASLGGGPGDDTLIGSEGPDEFSDSDGSNVMIGRGGADVFFLGSSGNFVDAGDGDDVIQSTGGNIVLGGAGNNSGSGHDLTVAVPEASEFIASGGTAAYRIAVVNSLVAQSAADAAINPVLVVTTSGDFGPSTIEIPIGEPLIHPFTGSDTGLRFLGRNQQFDVEFEKRAFFGTGTARIDVNVTAENDDLNDANNQNFATTEVLPSADLVVESVGLVSPTPLIVGQAFELEYVVRNIGQGPTHTSTWIDRIHLDVDDNGILDVGEGDVFVGDFAHDDAVLNPGEAYTARVTLTIPRPADGFGIDGNGLFNLILSTNFRGLADLSESSFSNNRVLIEDVEIQFSAPASPTGQLFGQRSLYSGRDQEGLFIALDINHDFPGALAPGASLRVHTFGDFSFRPEGDNSPNSGTFDFGSGTFEGTDLSGVNAIDVNNRFTRITGGGSVSGESGQGNFLVDPVTKPSFTSTFDLAIPTNPDLIFAIGTVPSDLNPFSGDTSTRGSEILSTDVVAEQTATVSVANGETRGAFAAVNLPLRTDVANNSNGRSVQYLVVVERDVPEGWDVKFRLPDESDFDPDSQARIDHFLEHGEILFDDVIGDIEALNGQILGFSNASASNDRVGASAMAGDAAAPGSIATVRFKVFVVGFEEFILNDVVEIKFQKETPVDLSAAPFVNGEAGVFQGVDVFELTPTALQTASQNLFPNETGAYQVNVVNRSSESRQFVLDTPTAASPNFEVRYTVGEPFTFGEDITAQITGAGFTTPAIAPGESFTISVEIQPSFDAAHGETFAPILRAFFSSLDAPDDAVKLEAVVAVPGDILAQAFSTGGEFVGGDEIGGEVSQPLSRGENRSFLVRVENDQLSFSKQFRMKATTNAPEGVTVQYFDPAGQDVTAAMVADGVLTPSLPFGEAHQFFVRVTADPSLLVDEITAPPFATIALRDPNSDPAAPDIDTITLKVDVQFPADLAAISVTPETSTVAVGEELTVDYTVANVGVDFTNVQTWADAVVLDVDGDGQSNLLAGDILLGIVRNERLLDGVLGANASYTDQVTFTIPGVTPGAYNLLLITDVGNEFATDNNRTNNLVQSVGAITIEGNPDVTPPTVSDVETVLNGDGSFTFSGVVGTEFPTVNLGIINVFGQVLLVTPVNGNGPFQINIPADAAAPGETILTQFADDNGGVTNVTVQLPEGVTPIVLEITVGDEILRLEDGDFSAVLRGDQVNVTTDGTIQQVEVTATATNGTLVSQVPNAGPGTTTLSQIVPVDDIVALLERIGFQPDPDFFGAANVQIEITDTADASKSATANVPITIENVNDLPSIAGITPTNNHDGTVNIAVDVDDVDGDTVTVIVLDEVNIELIDVAPIIVNNGQGQANFVNVAIPENGLANVQVDDGNGGIVAQQVNFAFIRGTDHPLFPQDRAFGGNVLVSFLNDDLVLFGDDADNAVEILIDDQGNLVARGLNGTKLNGSFADIILAGPGENPGNLIADMAGGNDVLLLRDGQFDGNADVQGGAGNDLIAAVAGSVQTMEINIRVADELVTHTLIGDFVQSVDGSGFGGVATIDGGSGDDQIFGTRGNDVLEGSEGSDTIIDGHGNDRISGGERVSAHLVPGSVDTLDAEGVVFLSFALAERGITFDTALVGVEQSVDADDNGVILAAGTRVAAIIGSEFGDVLRISVADGPSFVDGGAGVDSLTVDAGNQVVVQNGDTITIGANAPITVVNIENIEIVNAAVADSVAIIVSSLYQSILGREPDAAGGEAWASLLTNGASPLDVARGIWESPEHRDRQVDEYYQLFLGRAADAAGRSAWLDAFANGLSEQQVIAGFVTSAEYLALNPAPVAFVTALYADLLGREPDADGLAAFLALSDRPDFLPLAAEIVLQSTEYFQKTIAGFYEEFLGRSPDPAGAQGWLDALLANALSEAEVAQSILASEEYALRDGTE